MAHNSQFCWLFIYIFIFSNNSKFYLYFQDKVIIPILTNLNYVSLIMIVLTQINIICHPQYFYTHSYYKSISLYFLCIFHFFPPGNWRYWLGRASDYSIYWPETPSHWPLASVPLLLSPVLRYWSVFLADTMRDGAVLL